MKIVAAYRDVYLAHLAKGKLETEGIHAVVADEYLVGINWMYSQAIGGVKVQVPERDLEGAKNILEADYSENIKAIENAYSETDSENICPKCGSSTISLRPYSIWSLIPSLLFLLSIFFRRKKWACQRCGTVW